MHLSKVVVAYVALALLNGSLFAGEIVLNRQLGFRLTIPDGFVKDATQIQGDVLDSYVRLPQANQKAAIIRVERLRGVLGREKLNTNDAPKGSQATIVTDRWKGFEIEVFRFPEQFGELTTLTFNAQVPLKPEAIQVTVIGDATVEDELRSILRSMLGSLEGETNWLDEQQRSERASEGQSRLLIACGVIVLIGIAVIRFFVRKSKPTKK